MQNSPIIYHERLTSRITTTLFAGLSVIFLLLFLWRVSRRGMDGLVWFNLALSGVFLFYVINFRVLLITLIARQVMIRFGIIRWIVPLRNIETIELVEIPVMYQKGGAGVHVMSIQGRYRVSFNFLEYPRVVIRLRQQRGPVKDVSFSTKSPQMIIQYVREIQALAPLPRVNL